MKSILPIIALAGLAFGTSCALADNLFVSTFGEIVEFNTAVGAGSQSNFAGGLFTPPALAFDGSGNLFAADVVSGNIYKFTPAGSRSTFATNLSRPAGLAFDSAGNLFEADSSSGNIYKFTPSGSRSTFTNGLSGPQALAFDSSGNLYEADYNSGNIYKFTPGGSQSTFATFFHPTGLAFDTSGNLFVSDRGVGSIFKITPGGSQSTFASAVANGLISPSGLVFDSSGNLYEGDNGSGKIYKFTPGGGQSTFASNEPMAYGLAIQPVIVQILNPYYTNNVFGFSFLTQPGHNHYVEYKNALTNNLWTPLVSITGNGSLTNVMDNSANDTTRFYRVRTQ